jgi:signal transduction histidine kinase
MIADLLTISKLESGTFQLSMEKVNLSKIIKNLYSLFKDYALTKGIKIEMEVDEDIYIFGDEKYLSRAIANLLDNAIKFNKQDGKIIIKLKEIEGKVILIISDTGIGIPEDKLDKIFDKFYRADESRGVYMGSGLGLSLVKAVLDRHAAEIKVFSKENEGTTFEITFDKITNL